MYASWHNLEKRDIITSTSQCIPIVPERRTTFHSFLYLKLWHFKFKFQIINSNMKSKSKQVDWFQLLLTLLLLMIICCCWINGFVPFHFFFINLMHHIILRLNVPILISDWFRQLSNSLYNYFDMEMQNCFIINVRNWMKQKME